MMMMSIFIALQQLEVAVVVAADKELDKKDYTHHLIACGYTESPSTPISTLDGRSWSRDDPKYYSNSTSSSSSSTSAATMVVDPNILISKIPFGTAHVSQTNFTYTFPVEPGPKFIRLLFTTSSTYNLSSSSDSRSSLMISPDRFFFSVVSNTGAVLLQNFTAVKTGNDSKDSYMMREFFLTTPTGLLNLQLTFAPCLPSYYAFVNGIEVVSASPNLLYRYSDSDAGPLPPSSLPAKGFQFKNFQIGEWSSLETMYRVNVGGPEIQPTNDSSGSGSGMMYRHWDSDDIKGYEVVELPGYPPGQPIGQPKTSTFQVNYSASSTPECVAPAEVYMTGKEMGKHYFSKLSQRLKSNLTWRFKVDVGFFYLVRLHWCEVDSTVTEIGDREFEVNINNITALERVDLMDWGNGSRGIPIYRDYVVYQQQQQLQYQHDIVGSSSSSTGRTDYLWVSLRPVPTGLVNVILNGVEIFKANRSYNSLANPNANPLPPQQQLLLPDHNDHSSHSPSHHLVIILIIVVVVGVVSVFLLVRTTQRYFLSSQTTRSATGGNTSYYSAKLPSDRCRRFSLHQLRSATLDFSESLLIGSGGFGGVYRGPIEFVPIDRHDKGSTTTSKSSTKTSTSTTTEAAVEVAIKRLNQMTSNQGAREFITEIEMLSRLCHANLVPLIGYCDEQGEMALVYEYMPRGTLRDHLVYHPPEHPPVAPDHDHPTPLSWERRLSICIGAAKGLHYLYSGATHMVIHRDVKSTNILLDHNWAAKVADFGLSKLVVGGLPAPPRPRPAADAEELPGGEEGGETVLLDHENGKLISHITTAVKGSVGYLDPDYFKTQHLTEKSDVYSFGVVVFEVLCGRPAIDLTLPKDQVNLAMWARTCHQQGSLDQILDPSLLNNSNIPPSPNSLKKFGDIAEMCVREQGIDRPSMADVVWGLEFALQLQTTSTSSPSYVVLPEADPS